MEPISSQNRLFNDPRWKFKVNKIFYDKDQVPKGIILKSDVLGRLRSNSRYHDNHKNDSAHFLDSVNVP